MTTPASIATAPSRGRPRRTTRDEVARTALELFVRDGFEQTTLDAIAAALGIGRRTLFRYFASKNDMVWGDFDSVIERLRDELRRTDPGEDIMEALRRAVVASNHYEGPAREDLRLRMTLITTVPALQAHSMVRYAAWRAVVSEFVAARTGSEPDAFVPLAIGHMALGASMAAFVRWVHHPDESLEEHLLSGYASLARGFASTG